MSCVQSDQVPFVLSVYLQCCYIVYVQVYRTNSIHNTIFMVVLPHFATLMPSICSYFTVWKYNVPELDKVNFWEARASMKLRNYEVARPDGVTFPSGWERCDVPSIPQHLNWKGGPN